MHVFKHLNGLAVFHCVNSGKVDAPSSDSESKLKKITGDDAGCRLLNVKNQEKILQKCSAS